MASAVTCKGHPNQNALLVRVVGGLGNQMFQYAAGLALSKRLGKTLLIDGRAFKGYRLHQYGLSAWNLSARQIEGQENDAPALWRIGLVERMSFFQPATYFKEQSLAFDQRWPQVTQVNYLSGYFQTERYFIQEREQLTKEFSLNVPLQASGQDLAQEMRNSHSVAIHVRRGDYVSNPQTLRIHGVCGVSYYQAAINYMLAQLNQPQFYIFSNDFAWVRANLKLPERTVFVDGVAQHAADDIHLMSQCKHHIVANSSFSWWGAWLAHDQGGIHIAPTPWYDDASYPESDLIPTSWVRLPK